MFWGVILVAGEVDIAYTLFALASTQTEGSIVDCSDRGM